MSQPTADDDLKIVFRYRGRSAKEIWGLLSPRDQWIILGFLVFAFVLLLVFVWYYMNHVVVEYTCYRFGEVVQCPPELLLK